MRRLWSVLGIAALAYGGLCLLAWLFQDRLVYFPLRRFDQRPEDLGLVSEELHLDSGGHRLHGWYLPAAEERGSLLFCHGNGGNISHRLAWVPVFHRMGLGVLHFDYRGYGASEGRPSELATYADAEAAYEWLTRARGVPPERIVFYGESLGAAVAIELALRRPAAALVLEAPFTSLPAVGAHHYPFLPVRLLARNRYDNLAKVPRLDLPLFVMHSPEDRVVPFAMGRAVFEAAPEGAAFLQTAAGHDAGGFLLRPEWRARVQAFLEGALAH
jgi:hypothetical protein